jgi:hypothetical protein
MVAAILYEHENFKGESLFLSSDDNNLTDNELSSFLFWSTSWNDQVSSLRVIDGSITVYEHVNYEGDSKYFGPGSHSSVGNLWNDQISSVDLWGV